MSQNTTCSLIQQFYEILLKLAVFLKVKVMKEAPLPASQSPVRSSVKIHEHVSAPPPPAIPTVSESDIQVSSPPVIENGNPQETEGLCY